MNYDFKGVMVLNKNIKWSYFSDIYFLWIINLFNFFDFYQRIEKIIINNALKVFLTRSVSIIGNYNLILCFINDFFYKFIFAYNFS